MIRLEGKGREEGDTAARGERSRGAWCEEAAATVDAATTTTASPYTPHPSKWRTPTPPPPATGNPGSGWQFRAKKRRRKGLPDPPPRRVCLLVQAPDAVRTARHAPPRPAHNVWPPPSAVQVVTTPAGVAAWQPDAAAAASRDRHARAGDATEGRPRDGSGGGNGEGMAGGRPVDSSWLGCESPTGGTPTPVPRAPLPRGPPGIGSMPLTLPAPRPRIFSSSHDATILAATAAAAAEAAATTTAAAAAVADTDDGGRERGGVAGLLPWRSTVGGGCRRWNLGARRRG